MRITGLLVTGTISLIIFTCSSAFGQETSYPEKGNQFSSFILKIHGIDKIKGEVRIAVFNSKETYADKKDSFRSAVVSVESDTVSWEFAEFPFGEYAIAVYHDENMNGEMDTNLLGIPKEDYGFSNNARGRFGPASWEDARFIVSQSINTHSIKLN
ncbi:MAG: DUF2141 domain-containing protein [Balneolaceae bacterium]|nr:DUF2141 domain-containing protein [Balneolaceae bacterium]